MQWQRWQRRIWEGRGIFLTTPLAAGLVIALRGLGGLQFLEWDSLDLFFRWRPPEPTDPRIVLVAIREKDIRTLKQYPISDEVLARAIRNISQHQPRAIALDFYRDLPVHPGHQELLDVFATVPNLIGIEKVSNRGELSVPPPPLLQERDRVAAANLLIDKDGTIRRALLGVTLPQGGFRLSLGARMALEYLEAEGIPLETLPDYRVRLGQAVFIPFESSDGGYVRADDRGFQTLFNFRTRRCPPLPEFCQRFVTFSLSQVLAGEIPADLLRDRLVFIGTTAISIPDRFFTPYSSTYSMAPWGVEIHADLASMIISAAIDDRPLLRTLPESLEIASILLWSGIGSTLGWMFLRTRWKFFSLFLAGSSAVLFAYLAFLVGWWLPLVPSLVALALSEVAITVYIVYVEREDRLAIMNLLGQHVTPKIARAVWHERHDLLKKGQLVGTRLTATVLFTDLKDFTRISESLDPETLMVWLNDYMKTMSEVVLAQDGVVDKFIGDSVMAVFGVPLQRTTEA
ncbi:MAG: CHASE2 domain-containing protein, partial [Spirulina sp.]